MVGIRNQKESRKSETTIPEEKQRRHQTDFQLVPLLAIMDCVANFLISFSIIMSSSSQFVVIIITITVFAVVVIIIVVVFLFSLFVIKLKDNRT